MRRSLERSTAILAAGQVGEDFVERGRASVHVGDAAAARRRAAGAIRLVIGANSWFMSVIHEDWLESGWLGLFGGDDGLRQRLGQRGLRVRWRSSTT